MEHHPEVHGDALLNGEPAAPSASASARRVRCGSQITVSTRRRARRLYACQQERDQDRDGDRRKVEKLGEIKPQISDNVRAAIDAGRATMDRAMGPGAGASSTR